MDKIQAFLPAFEAIHILFQTCESADTGCKWAV